MKMFKTLLLVFALFVSGSIFAESTTSTVDTSSDTAAVSEADTKSNVEPDATDADKAAVDIKLLKKQADSADSSSDTTHSSHDAMNTEQSAMDKPADVGADENEEEEEEDDEPDADDC